ncbi:S-layer homology domain-containing protein [Paenibacillus sp. F6_3S_P_1C]|uniref:S-layer homology domain-containing protein n=1 Tax=Paenibacillus vandeheii TaxID=3035917 RepID=A0ABT8JDT6_9BACL|nr:S-layer homology domain-containing protein [Paenibacillus vandeheii]MDN4603043.1 S-layer homology domain-containing protein [Paenibacillus vandeheii]
MITGTTFLSKIKTQLPEVSDTTKMVLSKYTDADQAGIWSKEALAICIELGLIQGTPDHKLNPKRNLTQAEAAVLFSRLLMYCSTDKSDLPG